MNRTTRINTSHHQFRVITFLATLLDGGLNLLLVGHIYALSVDSSGTIVHRWYEEGGLSLDCSI